MSGWIRLHRGWRDCDVFGDEPMTEREAWVWLIEKAAWKACVRRNAKGERVHIDRGQFHTSFRNLGTAWGWGKNRVSRFLERLEEHEMIGTVAGQSGCTITICNYDVYQDMRDSLPQEAGTVAGQSRDTQEEGKEYKEDKYTSEAKASSVTRARKSDRGTRLPDDWEPVLTPRAQGIVEHWPDGRFEQQLRAFKDHAADKGRISKDWQAAFRTWIGKADEYAKPNYQHRPAVGRTAQALASLRQRRTFLDLG